MLFSPKILPAQNKITNSVKKAAVAKSLKHNKRKRKRDRRSSVRDGVIVKLSYASNRRNGIDRRRLQTSY